MQIRVGSSDIGANVIAGTYAVNNKPDYSVWKDANHVNHKTKLRDRISGSFEMFFRTVEAYQSFVQNIQANTQENAVLMTVTVNNTGEEKTGYFFIDYELTRNRDANWDDYFARYKVKIEER